MNPSWVSAALRDARVARMATVSATGAAGLVPICFTALESRLLSAVDHKPKRRERLRRLDDITATATATVLVDHYDEDWDQLWWTRIRGAAAVHADTEPIAAEARAALVAKYPQYRELPPQGPVYSVRLDEMRWWRAADR